MNHSLSHLFVSGVFRNSPFISTRGRVILESFRFQRSFSCAVLTSGFTKVFSSVFHQNLDTCVHIRSLECINQSYFTQFSFTFDSVNVFRNCIFRSISSSHRSSGILFQINGLLEISFCVFSDLSASYSGWGGTALYVTSGTSVFLHCNTFSYCRSPHGASYGIHTDQYSIGNVTYALNSESFVGYKGIQGHSSFLGGRVSFNCLDNNASHIESSGNSGMLFLLVIPTNCDTIRRCLLANSKVSTLLFSISTPSFQLFNICMQNSTGSMWFSSNQGITIRESSFLELSKNPTWSSTYQFVKCEFDKSVSEYNIPSSIIYDCSFSVTSANEHKPNLFFECEHIYPKTLPSKFSCRLSLFVFSFVILF